MRGLKLWNSWRQVQKLLSINTLLQWASSFVSAHHVCCQFVKCCTSYKALFTIRYLWALFVADCVKCRPLYRVSQEECAILREGVPYVKIYRYKPKHLSPKLNGYGDNGQRKVRSCVSSTHYTLKAVDVISLTLTSACGRSLLSPSLPVFLSRIVLGTQTTTTT
jgi:hypothetical protein